jgi:hypothetical protein
MFIEQGILRESDSFSDRRQRNAPSPASITNEIPGSTVRHVIEDLKDHDACPFKGGLPMTDLRIGDNVFA